MRHVPKSLRMVLDTLRRGQIVLRESFHFQFMLQLARALGFIHSHNICHRDLKPDNVLVDTGPNYRVFLCDFGCAKVIPRESEVVSQTYMCSRFYRAPELIVDRDLYGLAVDIWSFGCVFVESCTGSVLFQAEDNVQLLARQIRLLGTITQEDACSTGSSRNNPLDFSPIERAPAWGRLFRRRTFGQAYETLCQQVLQFNSRRRPTAMEMLDYDYLNQVPGQTRAGA